MRKTSTQWYNHGGYTREVERIFVEYTLSDGTLKTAGFPDSSADYARTFAEELGSPVQGGGCTFVRMYRVFRGKEKAL